MVHDEEKLVKPESSSLTFHYNSVESRTREAKSMATIHIG